jgi:probable DNA metabolism protein
LKELFLLLENGGSCCGAGQVDLFGLGESEAFSRRYEQSDLELACFIFSDCFDPCVLCEAAGRLFELSVNAFDAFVFAWLSEEPVLNEALRFARRALAQNERKEAERVASDRGDEDTRVVLETYWRVQHEAHRFMGLLRFSPDSEGVYTAHCEPDHFILPALAQYFTERFGQTPWAIIDEKRSLVLSRKPGKRAILVVCGENAAIAEGDEWTDLWRHYHKTINNESRKNPRVQRQFMPERYWKYLPEQNPKS